MKKLTKILIIITSIFIGLNGVNAEKYDGKCKLSKSSVNGCTYVCNYSVGDESLSFNFMLNSNGENNYTYDDTINKLKFSANDNACKIFPSSTVDLKYVDDKQVAFCYSYSDKILYLGDYSLSNSLKNEYFNDSVYDFACRDIKTSMTIESEKLDRSEYSMGTKYQWVVNHINISVFQASDNATEIEHPVADNTCGILGSKDSKTVLLIKKLYGYVKVIIPIIVIVYGMIDFIKVVFSGKDDDMKKAINNFAKRIIIAIVFILVPTLVSFIIKFSGVTSQYSGINDGLKTVFCILS